jgi:ribosomal protein L11
MKVTVRLSIQNRVATVDVIPSASALIIKALAEPARDRKKEKNSTCFHFNTLHEILMQPIVKHHGNITLDDVIKIARTMQPRSLSKELAVCLAICTSKSLSHPITHTIASCCKHTLTTLIGHCKGDLGYMCFSWLHREWFIPQGHSSSNW